MLKYILNWIQGIPNNPVKYLINNPEIKVKVLNSMTPTLVELDNGGSFGERVIRSALNSINIYHAPIKRISDTAFRVEVNGTFFTVKLDMFTIPKHVIVKFEN